jgi:hypothetical protein
MAIYRFKVSFEDYDEVNRIIEIKSTQTFLDFHHCIQESIKFDNKHAASFFVSDDFWRKNDEITLLEEDADSDTKLMAKTKIASHIEHPYQRFIYLYDKKVQWSFLVELIKIDKENPKSNYPTCVKSNGSAPKQYKQNLIQPETPSIQDPILAALAGGAAAELLIDDELEDEAYNSAPEEEDMGLNEGDLDFAQSEEGEEEENTEEGNEESEGGEDDYGFNEESGDDNY